MQLLVFGVSPTTWYSSKISRIFTSNFAFTYVHNVMLRFNGKIQLLQIDIFSRYTWLFSKIKTNVAI